MEFLIANLAPIMFATLIIFLLLGFPVAFALAANGILFGLVGMELGLLNSSLFQALPQRVFGIISNDTLLAVPFFTLMGLVLERSGMAEDLLETIGQLFGSIRGGGVRGRDAGRDHGRGVGVGHFHGLDIAADHVAQRL
jgi:TRAP-type mannitol/chloroaromatic compound transport system permease large subunit